jgi:hypothetical protein
MNNTPKPHAFTSLLLQSSSSNGGEDDDNNGLSDDPGITSDEQDEGLADERNEEDGERIEIHERQLEKYKDLGDIADKADRGEELTDEEKEK